MVAGGCTVSVAAVVAGWVTIAAYFSGGERVTLGQTLAALDEGNYLQARDLAKTLQSQGRLPVEELGGPVFVLGAAACREADEMWSSDRRRYYLLAGRYLEEARDRGFPPGRQGEGYYLLGKSLYLSGQILASQPVLLTALGAYPQKETEIHRLLAGAYFDDANPKLEKALAENSLYLADGRLPTAARSEGLIQRARILLQLGRVGESLAALEEIEPQARSHAEAMILRGRIMMHEAQILKDQALKDRAQTGEAARGEWRQKFQQAIQTLRRAQGRDTLSIHATRKAIYLIGICFRELDDHPAALNQFARIRQLHRDTPEALAADFQEAELSRQLGRDADALAAYRRTLQAITDPENFSNPWITLERLRERMLANYEYYLDAQKFDVALQLTRVFYPLFSRVRTLELMAGAYEAWGHELLGAAAELPLERASQMRRLGRGQLRQAGRVHTRLAQLQITTRKYPDELWAAAAAYFEGHDYDNTIRMLQKYLKNESSRRHPPALTLLGRSMLAAGRTDEALDVFRRCVEFHPRNAAAFRARLSAGRAYLEKSDFRQAEKLLLENLSGEGLTPKSTEWRDSLFLLGNLLHIERRYRAAIRRLEEAVARYPDCDQTIQARYQIADSYRQTARIEREKLKKDLAGTARTARSREIDTLLEQALDHYGKLRETLLRRQESHQLTAVEKATLRNCYFAAGDILFDLARYEAAVKAYTAAINRYQNHAEVLEAYVQVANVYQRLNKPNEARKALAQAKVVLGHMKPDTQFAQTTNYTRQQWSDRLDRLAKM